MDVKIDYLSFTVGSGIPGLKHKAQDWEREMLWREIVRQVNQDQVYSLLDGPLDPARGEWSFGRGHYTNRIYWEDSHIALWFGGAGHILLELPGTACQLLRDLGDLGNVVKANAQRITRVDLACDFITRITPLEFVAAGVSPRIKTRSQIVSSTGQTVYLGSPNSDRFARVYQYNDPHPRAGMLRVEFVNRRTSARAVIDQLTTTSLRETGTMLGNSFGLEHWLWTDGKMTEDRLKVTRAMTHGSGTVIWFYRAVVPALQKLQREGILSIEEIVQALTGTGQ